MAVAARSDPWRERLTIPNYDLGEAARYARVAPQTVARWHKEAGRGARALPAREARKPLSYLQLVEVAVVAALRGAGMKLQMIREARDYLSGEFGDPYPFALFRFTTDGKRLLLPFDQFEGEKGKGKLFSANDKGQLGWSAVIQTRLQEFEYDQQLALRWHLGGPDSAIVLDPRIAFGAPALKGVPTWALKERWVAGEALEDTAEDFGLKRGDVRSALEFEGVDFAFPQPKPWQN